MRLYMHSEAGFYVAPSASEAEAMAVKYTDCDPSEAEGMEEVDPARVITVTDEDKGTETKTAGEWLAEARAGGFTGYVFGPLE